MWRKGGECWYRVDNCCVDDLEEYEFQHGASDDGDPDGDGYAPEQVSDSVKHVLDADRPLCSWLTFIVEVHKGFEAEHYRHQRDR